MANFNKVSVRPEARTELHDLLGLTGAEVSVNHLPAGDWIRVSPAAKRQFFAAEDSAISYVCIQVKENSLEGYTQDDAVV